MLAPAARNAMMGLGFTALEADIYAFLLSESPATGYRIAQAIRKPAANTYKGIESLVAKGCAVRDEAGIKPIPLDELLAQLSLRFEQQIHAADTALRPLGGPARDESLGLLENSESILARLKRMISESQKQLRIATTSPLTPALVEALIIGAERGIEITLELADRTLAAHVPEGVAIIDTHPAVPLGPGTLLVSSDDAEVLLATGLGESALALHTAHPRVAPLLARGIKAELALAEIAGLLDADAGRKRLARAIAAFGGAITPQ